MEKQYSLNETYFPHAIISDRHERVVCPRHMHISPEIVMVNRGVLHMAIDDKVYEMPSGTCAFIPPLIPHEFISNVDNECRVITFAKEILFESCPRQGFGRVERYLFVPSEILFKLVEFYLPTRHGVGDTALAMAVLMPMLYEIAEQCGFKADGEMKSDAFLSVLKYLSENYREQLSLEQVAVRAGLHPVSLSRTFSARTGISFTKFMKYLRATAAADLMKIGNMSFTEIAFEVGFGSVRSFNRAFFELFEITPSEYKARFLNI